MEMVPVIVIVPKMILDEILDHAGSHPDREVIGVLLGKSMGKIIEITDIVSYPEASYPEKAVLPGTFLYGRIGDEMRERNYSVNVKGYYHSHPPDIFPLKFSQIDMRQYEDLQNIFARKQPFLAIIVNPDTREYAILTLDIDGREIHLEPFYYENLVWVDYAVKRFTDGFSPYRIDPKTGEGTLHPKFRSFLEKMAKKYEKKKIVKIMLQNALKYGENMEKYAGEIENAQNLLKILQEAKALYFTEDFAKADRLLEQFIKSYVEEVSDKIEELHEPTTEPVTASSQSVSRINQKMHALVRDLGKRFPNDAARIAGIVLDMKRKIDDLGEPYCYIGIDKAMNLIIPPGVSLTVDHLKHVEDMLDEEIIEHLGQDYLGNLERLPESEDLDDVEAINHLLDSYYQHYYEGTSEQLMEEINEALIFKYVKKGYSMKGLIFENLTLSRDTLREIFGDSYQNILHDIGDFIKDKIQKDIGTERLQELLSLEKK